MKSLLKMIFFLMVLNVTAQAIPINLGKRKSFKFPFALKPLELEVEVTYNGLHYLAEFPILKDEHYFRG